MAEIAIVGGGPAGLACAIFLAERNIPVVVFEPDPLPRDKPCGEGIMPEGVSQLQRLGVLQNIARDSSSFFKGVCFVNENNDHAYSHFKNGVGLGCRRLALSTALYKRCLAFSSIEIRHEKIRALKLQQNRVDLFGDRTKLSARLLIGADGLRSRVRSFCGLKGRESVEQRYGLRRHFAIKPWSSFVLVHFRAGIEAYITPCGHEQTNVTFLWSKEILAPTVNKISFETMLSFFPSLHNRLKNKTPLSEQMAIGPLRQRCPDVITDGVALVGDASGYYDAITGEGISIALEEADALAKTLAKAMAQTTKGLITKHDLLPYRTAHRKITRLYARNTALLLWFAKRPRLMQKMIEMGAMKPETFSWLIETSRHQ